MMNKYSVVTMTGERFEELLAKEELLEALIQSGVDNWSGYDAARELLDSWQEETP